MLGLLTRRILASVAEKKWKGSLVIEEDHIMPTTCSPAGVARWPQVGCEKRAVWWHTHQFRNLTFAIMHKTFEYWQGRDDPGITTENLLITHEALSYHT
jgi:hypothetical protein